MYNEVFSLFFFALMAWGYWRFKDALSPRAARDFLEVLPGSWQMAKLVPGHRFCLLAYFQKFIDKSTFSTLHNFLKILLLELRMLKNLKFTIFDDAFM